MLLGDGFSAVADATQLLDLFEPLSARKDCRDGVLCVAVQARQPLAVIERLLVAGYLEQAPGVHSALHRLHRYPAADQGALLDLLARYGANVNHASAWECTPLWQAILFQPYDAEEGERRLTAVRGLVSRGADVNVPRVSMWAYRPLHYAAKFATPWNTEMVRVLLDAGADIDAGVGPNPLTAVLGDSNAAWALEDTPLMLACRAGCLETVALLLQRGANGTLRDSKGDTALHYAARSACREAGRLLLDAYPFASVAARAAALAAWQAKDYAACWALL